MSRPLALLRPEPGWSASAVAAGAAGLEVIGHPLFAGEPVEWRLPEQTFDALLIGSAAVFEQGGPQLMALQGLPVQAVGKATAEAARAAGFAVERTGEGGLQALLDAESSRIGRYLRLGGEERVPLAPHPGQAVIERTVYRQVARPLEPELAAALADRHPIVALHSAAAARHFAQEVDRLALPRGALVLLALGPRILEAAGIGWAGVQIADKPSDAALLAKALALCN